LREQYQKLCNETWNEANSIYTDEGDWSLKQIERNRRRANREGMFLDHEGHIASEADLREFSSPAGARASPSMYKALLGLLRDKDTGLSGIITHDDLEMSEEGWVSIKDLVEIIEDEIPACRMTKERLVSLVRADAGRRMQLWFSHTGRSYFMRDLTHIRATCGHSEKCKIDPVKLFGRRQQFNLDNCPSFVYYYTDVHGMMSIWHDRGVGPQHSKFGARSSKFIMCSPVRYDNDACPDACTAHKESFEIQVMLDFRMMIKDGITAYYTADGHVAIKAECLGAAYIAQINSVANGAFWYLRNFEPNDRYYTGKTEVVPSDSSNHRCVAEEPCYVCNTRMWRGAVTCFQCRVLFCMILKPLFLN